MSASTSSQVSNSSMASSTQSRGQSYNNARRKFKLLVIGSASVGKTTMLRQFIYHTFDPKSTQTTIGCDFWHRNLAIHPDPLDQTKTTDVSLQVWDTAGMDAGFESLAPSFFRGADGALLVYDLTNPQSFHQSKTWRDKFVTYAGAQAPILLVGNKLDLKDERKVTKEMADQFVRDSIQMSNSSSSNLALVQQNQNKGIMVCGAVEITAADADAVERAFIKLTTSMLEVEKTRSASEVVSQKDLKRLRLGSVPSSNGDPKNGGGNGKKCSC